MKTLLTFILLLAVGITEAAEQRFVPYNPATGATLGGIVYTNGTFTGNGAGLTNLPMVSLVGTQLNFGEGATITRGVGEVLEFSTEIVGMHVGTGDGLTNLNASALGSGTVPAARNTVQGSINTSGGAIGTNGFAWYVGTNASGSDFRVGPTNSTTPTLFVGGVTGSPRVGIGTLTPGATLDVNGIINITTGVGLRWANGNAQIVNSTYDLLFQTYDGVSALTEKMRIKSTGNVGIGTASPGAKLDVAGTVNASNFVATAVATTTPAFKSSVTNNMILKCPDGGTFILRVDNLGVLTAVTNTSGL